LAHESSHGSAAHDGDARSTSLKSVAEAGETADRHSRRLSLNRPTRARGGASGPGSPVAMAAQATQAGGLRVSVTGIAPQRSLVVAKARELVAVARRCGYQPAELAEIIAQVSMELP
jgi:hypothetical protein